MASEPVQLTITVGELELKPVAGEVIATTGADVSRVRWTDAVAKLPDTVRGHHFHEVPAVGLAGEHRRQGHGASGPGPVVDAVLVSLHSGGGVGAVPFDDDGGDQRPLVRGDDGYGRGCYVHRERDRSGADVVGVIVRSYVDGVRRRRPRR